MAVRSAAEVADLIQAITEIGYNFETYLTGACTTDLGALETQIAVGDQVPENAAMTAAMTSFITAMGRAFDAWKALSRSSHPALGRLGGSPNLSNFNQNIDYFQAYLVANSIEIEKRGFTKDTAATVSGSGVGVLSLGSVDLNGDIIDFGNVEDFVLECSRDYASGSTAGAEEFHIRGAAAGKYPWLEGGSGLSNSYSYPFGIVPVDFAAAQPKATSGGTLKAVGGSSSAGNLIKNGDFEQPISGTGGTKLPDWTINAGDTTLTQETSDPITGTYSLAATADFEMDHFLAQGRVKPGTFASLAIKVERKSSATGTLTVKLMDADEGTTHGTLTIDISTLTNDTPVVQAIAAPFDVPLSSEDLKVQVELASLATGTIKIDDVMLTQATLVNGYTVAVFDGTTKDASGYSQGRFKKGDTFTIQTTSAEGGLIQRLFANFSLGRYFRSATSATTDWEDPS